MSAAKAFPGASVLQSGMDLRDWFAGQVANGLAAHSGTMGPGFGPGEIASRAYTMADAMMAERERRQGGVL